MRFMSRPAATMTAGSPRPAKARSRQRPRSHRRVTNGIPSLIPPEIAFSARAGTFAATFRCTTSDSNGRRRADRGWRFASCTPSVVLHQLRSRIIGLSHRTNARTVSVVEMKIGKWYDPISERWFVPREVVSAMMCSQPSGQSMSEIHRRTEEQRAEAQRIWELLVDCCAYR